eukprot:3806907-Prymnesium_polylepis.1
MSPPGKSRSRVLRLRAQKTLAFPTTRTMRKRRPRTQKCSLLRRKRSCVTLKRFRQKSLLMMKSKS